MNRVRPGARVEDLQGTRMLRPNDVIRLGQTIRTGRTSAIEINFDLDGRLLVWPGARMVLREPGPASDRRADCQSEVVARIELRRGTSRSITIPMRKWRS